MTYKDFENKLKERKEKPWQIKFTLVKKDFDWEYPLVNFFRRLLGKEEIKK